LIFSPHCGVIVATGVDNLCPLPHGFITECVLHTSMVKHIRMTMEEDRFSELEEFKQENGYNWKEVLEHGVIE